MLELVYDTEGDGLLAETTKLHLITARDLNHDIEYLFRDTKQATFKDYPALPQNGLKLVTGTIEDGLALLAQADLLVAHNQIDHDIPVIEKLHPGWETDALLRDTLVLSRLLFSNIKEDDYVLFRKGKMPGGLLGSHGIKAWGYRLEEFKGDYQGGWAAWNPEMEAYARQDAVVGKKLWLHVQRRAERDQCWSNAIRTEHRFADLVAQIERNGFPFKEDEAKVLYEKLKIRKDEITERLLEQFRPWWTASKWQKGKNDKPLAWREAEIETPTKTLNYKEPGKPSRTAGAPFCPIKRVEFNPGSRDQIAARLQRLYGWKPREFTETGKPKVSEDVLKDLVGVLDSEEDGIEETEGELYDRLIKSVPKAKDLADYFLVTKRIGQLAEGKNGWLKLVRNGKVHGSINSLGAVTRRVTHARPNMSQCPAIRSDYGWEMRELWHSPRGWLQFGTDLSGIEIRCFADALAEFDNGEYARLVIEDDIHTVNQQAFGVPTRDNAKTTLYALLYGAGDAKLGAIIEQGPEAGRRIKKNFMAAVPAYPQVVRRLDRLVERQGWIPALDGGRLHVRSAHKALNTSLQSAGAIIAKRWTLRIEERLLEKGWNHGWNGDFVMLGWFHDEIQFSVRSPNVDPDSYRNDTDYASWTVESAKAKDAEDLKKKIKAHKAAHHQKWYYDQSAEIRLIAAEVKQAIKDVEEEFSFRCPLDCEYKIGQNWADCH